jgi:hypothetical protein
MMPIFCLYRETNENLGDAFNHLVAHRVGQGEID